MLNSPCVAPVQLFSKDLVGNRKEHYAQFGQIRRTKDGEPYVALQSSTVRLVGNGSITMHGKPLVTPIGSRVVNFSAPPGRTEDVCDAYMVGTDVEA